MTTFLPSLYGFHFPNDFVSAPIFLGIGDASYGLCGGMTYAARANFLNNQPASPLMIPPLPHTPLFTELCRYQWQSIVRSLLGFLLIKLHGPDTVNQLLYKINNSLRYYEPVPLVLFWSLSLNVAAMAQENHQVLAYATDDTNILIYDPNHPDDDGLALYLDNGSYRHPDFPYEPILAVYANT